MRHGHNLLQGRHARLSSCPLQSRQGALHTCLCVCVQVDNSACVSSRCCIVPSVKSTEQKRDHRPAKAAHCFIVGQLPLVCSYPLSVWNSNRNTTQSVHPPLLYFLSSYFLLSNYTALALDKAPFLSFSGHFCPHSPFSSQCLKNAA